MGVLPLQFAAGQNVESLGLTGRERFTIHLDDTLRPLQDIRISVRDDAGKQRDFSAICRIDTPIEVEYYRNGGILHTVLRDFISSPQEP